MASKKTEYRKRRYVKRKLQLEKGCDGLCYICDQPMAQENSNLDHVYPRILVGNPCFNYMLAHTACNHAKDNRLPTRTELDRWARTYRKMYGKPDRRMWELVNQHGLFMNSHGSLLFA